MENTYKLIWAEEALDNLKGIIDYLERKWTAREVKKFANSLDQNLNLIKNNPKLFPEAELSGLRKCVLSKQTSIYYRIIRNEVHVLTLFDNRRHPKKLKGN